ncbi:ABC transporter substrate-binding protein [Raoultella ornithinolytica]|jgi:oligopeptide transport system substrate-binding protein|uniref:ABC transporter substrate-binding protein n=2 Tax=Raoultella ornithinolytica TaxID=54291 RepID=A0A855F7V6_RAOOR|nr:MULTISPECIES: ABC transporter substrate-binding protein [Raoultella]HDX8331626.1 oligopeptide ABC transporter substrate-binding protein OppA [Raoultella ornithinolytica CD1_MRS_4]AGJ86650.1 putative extracellular solute-binding protein [Raoultella ornithinolytica B6]ANZ05407.1 peptide ABC transporter substrate-binding protein [Raoultella ornithinolytica]AOO56657.1 peptide ABC transporter substrate-binding protein [Raoultella ornithinolytica]ASI61496.1 oligopeptide ABC transporter substrate-
MKSQKYNHITQAVLALGLLCTTATVFAAQVPPGTVLAEKQELVRNNGSEPASLDPHKVESDVEFNIISDLFEGLVSVSPAGEIQPRLAEKWENKENTVWTFHLRPGITWSDGTAITAQDIVWSWQRLVSPLTASPYSSYPGNMHIVNAKEIAEGKKAPETLGVKAVDDATLEVTLTQPNAAFLAMLAHPSLVPIDKVLVNRFGEQWTKPEHIVTSGPYKLSAWVVNERIVAERNPRYWDNQHTVINKVTWLPIHSEAADVNRYKAGEIDIVYTVPINQFAQLKKTMGDQLNVSPQLATYYYEFNTTRPPFNDPRVRLALNMALDKDIIAEKVLGQGQRPAWLISQPDIGGVKLQNPEYASWPREKRIAEAKKLLSEAGYSDSHPLVFNLLYNTSESHQRVAIAASSMWKKNLGVEAKLQNQEWKTMLDTMHTHNFDAVRYAWIADYDDAATFLNNFRTGDSENTSQYSNPAYDEALKNAAKASDGVTRGKYYQQAEDLLAKDVPAVPVYHYVRTHLVKPWVGGFTPDKLGYYFTKDMYIKKH